LCCGQVKTDILFKAALRAFPEHPSVYKFLIFILISHKRHKKARGHFRVLGMEESVEFWVLSFGLRVKESFEFWVLGFGLRAWKKVLGFEF